MGQKELEAALRRNADNRAKEIWAEVEAEAERLRCVAADELQREDEADKARCAAQIATTSTTLQAEAEQRAQRCRLGVEAALAKRLKQLSAPLLEQMAISGGEVLFQALAAEVPDHPWQQIRVNRRDRQLAEVLFPAAQISGTDEICAGLEAQEEEGRIMINNTLEKRLHHLWDEL
jgi:vacuolar-type H+-ATPase subunit E/Vma4